MRQVDQILKPSWVVPIEGSARFLEDHAIVIDQGRILDVTPDSSQYDAKQVHELPGHVVMPGIINMHTHAAMSYMRGYADDLPLLTWLQEHMWPIEAKTVNEEFITDGAWHACAEMIRSGTTCFNDMHFFAQETATVTHQVGMRARLAETIFHFPTKWSPTSDVCIARAASLIDAVKDFPLIEPGLGPHSTYGTDRDILSRVRDIAHRHQLPIHMHMHESDEDVANFKASHDGVRPLAYVESVGLLDGPYMGVHFAAVNEEDIGIMSKTGLTVVHCPESNLKLGNGYCPVPDILDAGVRVTVGTDSVATNNDLDMFGEMRTAAFLGKFHRRNPEVLPADQVLRMVTLDAAEALGFADEVGSVAVGKAADLIAVDLDQPETVPVFDPIAQLVYSTARSQVQYVWVAGKMLLERGNMTTIDMGRVMEKAHYWLDYINRVRDEAD